MLRKKLLAIGLAIVMAATGLTACTSETDTKGDNGAQTEDRQDGSGNMTISEAGEKTEASADDVDGETSFKIGYPTAPTYNAVMSAMHKNREAVARAAGGELVTEVFDFTPEGTVNAVEKLIQAGCDGVFVTPMAESVLPSIVSLCEDAGVYFVISMRSISDPEVKEIVEASDYYAGMVYEDEVSAGYAMGQALAQAGGKEYAIISTAVGDTTGALREQGLNQAAEEFGLTQVAEVRALAQAGDGAKAVESFIASYPDLSGIIRVASTATGDVNAIATAIENAGKAGEVKYITVDTEDGSEAFFETGTITATLSDLLVMDSVLASSLLVNAILETPVAQETPEIVLKYSLVENSEQLEQFYEYIACDTPIYTDEEIKSLLLKTTNPNLTLEDLQEMADNFSVSEVAERKQAQAE
ncbi:MAG: sugar ABC transporter substrate-binding protein [Catenibacillus sp.]